MKLFKMVKNLTESSRLKQRSQIKFLMTAKYKLYKVFLRNFDVHQEACFNQKSFYK